MPRGKHYRRLIMRRGHPINSEDIIICLHHSTAGWILPFLACIALIAGCSGQSSQQKSAAAPEIRPGILAGYLNPAVLPNSLALLPPPPGIGYGGFEFDKEVSRRSVSLQGTSRWELATVDAVLRFPRAADAFACTLGIPISENYTPYLYMLLRRTLADAGFSTYTAKNYYQRKRPFVLNGQPVCTPNELEFLMADGSYPSAHAAIGWAWALILSEIAPERADAILARGRAYGESRIICNVDWHSDVVAGRLMGAAVIARLHADHAFQTELKAAEREISAVRASGLRPARDCEAEVDALHYEIFRKP